jgi:glyoxylase-like metal-dependent hydrolase (beta-lactamase superfamily II)
MHLLDQFDVPIYLHEKDFSLLDNPGHIGYLKGYPYQLNKLTIIKMPEQLKLDDMTIDVIHTPGHSPGSVCLYYQDILIAGDTIFKESIGRTDLFLSSYEQIKKSIIMLMKLPMMTKIYPGHGSKTTIRHEKSHNSFVIKWLK